MSKPKKSKPNLDGTEEIEMISVKDIVPNKEQSTGIRDEEAFERLKQNIIAHGQQQPIKVRKEKNKFELIIGEHRWHVAKQLGKDTIKAIVMDVDANEASEIALSDNLCRTGYNPAQMEDMVHKRFKSGKYKNNYTELGRLIGLSGEWASRLIRAKGYRDELKKEESKLNLDDFPTNMIMELYHFDNDKVICCRDAVATLELINKGQIKSGELTAFLTDLKRWDDLDVQFEILYHGASYKKIKNEQFVKTQKELEKGMPKSEKLSVNFNTPLFTYRIFRLSEERLRGFIEELDVVQEKQQALKDCRVIAVIFAEALLDQKQITEEQYKKIKEILGVYIDPHRYEGDTIVSLSKFCDTETTEEETEK
jgi:ParB/RepB/Spo0J family partition protein